MTVFLNSLSTVSVAAKPQSRSAIRNRVWNPLIAGCVVWTACACSLAGGAKPLDLPAETRVAIVGNSTAQRMSLTGHFEAMLHLRTATRPLVVRNFGWPGDAVDVQQRPGNYTEIDDPLKVYAPQAFLCFFGFNESFQNDSAESLLLFEDDYHTYLDRLTADYSTEEHPAQFVLVTPIAFESTGHPLQPTGQVENKRLAAYSEAVKRVGDKRGLIVVDAFQPTLQAFDQEPGNQFTINGIHLNEHGNETLALILDAALFDGDGPGVGSQRFEQIRALVNDKAWLHQQDYRMLNGWYVYGGRRTWDTETFPGEYQKIRKMVAVRDQAIWDLATGKPVSLPVDDSATGEVLIPETMFGSRDDNFRKMREPKTLNYPTPEQSIEQMKLRDGLVVECFASEREFPELANPTQIAFDDRGRLWVACMVNYPQWLPGASRPSDRLLILEDTDGDGKADQCKTFYDKLICPTGFEFYKDGVLVVDEPHVLFLQDTDGDDRADEVTHMLDGIGTDDTHHAMGAWEYSNGGRLHLLEGIALSTTLETPWGPFRRQGASGSYVWDLESQRISHFKTPGQYNPWCLVFDRYGNGIVGDGTNAQHYWTSALSGGDVKSRKSLDPIFDNQGIRPAAGNEILRSRHFPDGYHDELVYACVINLHGLPAFELRDPGDSAAPLGKRTDDLLVSDDMFFRPVDPKIGPDGALYFGDWCNALIGHMQYSQRDPNRDHEHGRIYRLRHRDRSLIEPQTQANQPISKVLNQLLAFETRTRYRARRALRGRPAEQVIEELGQWLKENTSPEAQLEALWIQESFHQVDLKLARQIIAEGNFQQRAAAIHVLGNQWRNLTGNQLAGSSQAIQLTHDQPLIQLLQKSLADPHERVRLEAIRAASLMDHPVGVRLALASVEGTSIKSQTPKKSQSTDKWTSYVMEHALAALQTHWDADTEAAKSLVDSLSKPAAEFLKEYKIATGPGAEVYRPLKVMTNVDAEPEAHESALRQVIAASRANALNGEKVFSRVCAACHLYGKVGKKFGPELTSLGDHMSKEHVIRSIVWPNEQIAKGYETVMLLTFDGEAVGGFVLAEDDQTVTLGIADGKTKTLNKEDIELRKQMKASSMPEGLTDTIGPGEFLDLLAFLTQPWIATNPNLDYPLRTDGDLTEVSRDSMVRVGEGFPAKLNKEAQHLLSGEGVRKRDFAIHSATQPSDHPSVVIRFASPVELVRGQINNRGDKQFHDRALNLAVWVSSDAEQWSQVWKSSGPAPNWSVEFPPNTHARYMKIGLDGSGVLHIDRTVFYGRKLPES